ncbi:MAG: hypothetical protein CSA75_02245 [Sorangium cellulosum]|nr:MAG: hypothetical protein CSA75_02245 [Sorangium cellulosum]
MRAMTGRAVSAAIHQSLKDALTTGQPFTYHQLASLAGCTVRSVRNYLARSEEIFGFPISKSRDDSHRVVVQAIGITAPSSHLPPPDDPFDGALQAGLFPQEALNYNGPVIVAMRGFPSYGARQASIAKNWAREAKNGSPLTLHLESSILTLWPLAVIVHNLAGVILVGADVHQDDELIVIDLACVEDVAKATHPGGSRPAIHCHTIQDALGLPFWVGGPHADDCTVDVHVRFDPRLHDRLQSCLWHPHQKVESRKNGELDVRFGPVPLRAAACWVASFGRGVHVLGNKKLRKTIKKNSFSP